MARPSHIAAVLLLALALLGQAAHAAPGKAKICDPKDGWQSFLVKDSRVPNKMARSVMERTVTYVADDIKAKRIVTCPYSNYDAVRECMRSVIVKRVVQYGLYDMVFRLRFLCEDDEIVLQVRANSKVGRKGQILSTKYVQKNYVE